jgi:FkbM family methyltransferase
MATQQSNASANLASLLAGHEILANSPMTVMDIGASGGLDPMWRRFDPNMRAICFDPLVNEIERLKSIETDPNISYYDAWITSTDRTLEPAASRSGASDAMYKSFTLTSCMRAMELQRINYIKEQFNSGAELKYSERKLSIDEFIAETPVNTVDFIKVDTDGHDYYVLRGAEAAWQGKSVLGAVVECQFHGSAHEHANTFWNIDRYMKSQGLEIFDVDVQRYTRWALPGRFDYNLTASTNGGQAQWAEVLFLRDPVVRPELLEPGNAVGTPAKQLKLILLYDLFGLKDCAAHLILTLRDKGLCLPKDAWTPLLDRLAQGNPLHAPSYEAYIKEFEADPTILFPVRMTERDAKQKQVTAEIAAQTTVGTEVNSEQPAQAAPKSGIVNTIRSLLRN